MGITSLQSGMINTRTHKKHYGDLAGILAESGINGIKKNPRPEKDKPLIDNPDLTVNMIKKLDCHVERIEKEKTGE